MAEIISQASAPFRRTACIVASCLIATIGVMSVGPFELFSAGDLERIRLTESRLIAACHGHGGHIAGAVNTLLGYLHRSPYQPLPLHGGTKADGMLEELQVLIPQLTGSRCARARENLTQAIASRPKLR